MRMLKRINRWTSLTQVVTEDSSTEEHQVINLIELLARPWWGRVWIIQEVVLADQVIMHCGKDYLYFETALMALWDFSRLEN